MNVGIVVGTFGSEEWRLKGAEAAASALNQTVPADVVHVHSETLARARNEGAFGFHIRSMRSPDWLIFLDADDRLDPKYVESMLKVDGDIRKPSTFGVYPDGTTDDAPCMIPTRDLRISNHIVIGAMCNIHLFHEVGGFRELAALEDWDLWVRMVLAGASVVECPEAIYRVGVNPDSRNTDTRMHNRIYNQIKAEYREQWKSR